MKKVDPKHCSTKELAEYFLESVNAYLAHEKAGGADLINSQVFALALYERLKPLDIDPFSRKMLDVAETYLKEI